MLKSARGRAAEDSGFSMPEVLVVMMMIGILAAVAAPGFSCQGKRAEEDTQKAQVRAAASTMEAYANDNLGAYDGATTTILRSMNSQLPSGVVTNGYQGCSGPPDGQTCFSVRSPANAVTGNTFTLTKKADGRLLSSCTGAGTNGGCPSGGKWSAE